jgi:ABC-2 type transport system ATP-binding protein
LLSVDVIEVAGLRKEYRRLRGSPRVAVDGLDFAVPDGGVFGFLGPNGAGKTTTIRCLLGLVAPTAGTCRLLGTNVRGELPRVVGRVGAIVESPALFPTMSGRRNLELLGRLQRIGPRRVTATLERVGLAERADDLVKRYSLGMRQRLGLAAALLKDPEVLILDEPANGLDPAGIKEVRELLRGLGGEGRTVFVSSHLLSEVRQVCDQVAILARGRCVAAGPVAQVLSSARGVGLLVRLGDLERGRAVLAAAGIQTAPNGEVLRVALPPEEAATVTKALAAEGLYLTELRADEADLETVFLELTGEHPMAVAR